MRPEALNRRLAALEEKAKPRLISTLADLVRWAVKKEDLDEYVELSPELQNLIEEVNTA